LIWLHLLGQEALDLLLLADRDLKALRLALVQRVLRSERNIAIAIRAILLTEPLVVAHTPTWLSLNFVAAHWHRVYLILTVRLL